MSGIKVNKSDEKFFKEVANYTGVSLLKVLAVNPSLEKLQELGMNFQNEPNYLSEGEGGSKKVRLDFWVTNGELTTKMVFFLENVPRKPSQNGNVQIINNYGQSTWAKDIEGALARTGKGNKKWFKPEGARIALSGEVELMEFIANWLNVNPDDSLVLKDIEAFFTGDVSELEEYAEIAKDNKFYGLLTVTENEGKFYQNVYNKLTLRSQFREATAIQRVARHIKSQEEAGYPIKAEYSLTYQVYTPTMESPKPDNDFITPSPEKPDF